MTLNRNGLECALKDNGQTMAWLLKVYGASLRRILRTGNLTLKSAKNICGFIGCDVSQIATTEYMTSRKGLKKNGSNQQR